MWIMFERHFEKRHFQYHLQSQKFGVVKVSEFSTAATVHDNFKLFLSKIWHLQFLINIESSYLLLKVV
jgi:hypothetical protein